jgi:lipoprotein signal peptidase
MDFIKSYFTAEKSESLLFMLTGVAAISFSAFALLKWNESFYKKVEIAFIVIGLLLVIFAPAKEFWLGIGVGMLLQGTVMLSLDIFAEKRGGTYIREIEKKT